jgi:protein gp37
MNKQKKKLKDGSISRGIEWCDYTYNPIKGCMHGCQWTMPNGQIANCYAENVAEKVAQAAYPHGFEHHYWEPKELEKPLNVKAPSRIFVGSMADVFGHWVPEEQVQAIIDVARRASWHTFIFLTKNVRRVMKFQLPDNCWVGASSPPDYMWGKKLTDGQRERMLTAALNTLTEIKERGIAKTTWMSAEPLTIPLHSYMNAYPNALNWIVIGAASNGAQKYAPEHEYVVRTVETADKLGAAVFFKGNLRSLPWAAENWREEFPWTTSQP